MARSDEIPLLVSVVIPCYNAGATIGRALNSVRQQTYSPTEIIVVDDCSSDDTAAVLAGEGARDQSLQILRLPQNSGAAAARNAGIARARGQYIAFLDADDEWLPEKLALQMSVISARPEMSLVACKSRFVKLDGTIEESLYGDLEPATGPEAWRVLLAYNFIATPTVVARRQVIERVGSFDPDLVIGEDQDLWIRLALAGEVGYIDQILAIVHEQSDGLSRRSMLRILEFSMPMLSRHFEAQKHRLSHEELNHILGHRYTKLGRNAYQFFPLRGLRLLLKAVALGHERFENLAYILRASPPARWAKVHMFGRPQNG